MVWIFYLHNSYTYSNSWNQDISRWRSTMGNLWVETLLIQGWYRLTSHSPFKEILKRKQTRALEKPLIIMLFERVLSIFWWKLGLKYPAFCASFGHFSLLYILPQVRGQLRRSAVSQVTLVAQIPLHSRFVFNRSPFRARCRVRAMPTFHLPTRLQTLSSLLFVTSSAQILPFVQFTLIPGPSGVGGIADETPPPRFLHVLFRPTREAQILVQSARFAEVSPLLLAIGTDFCHTRALWSVPFFQLRVVSRAVHSRERYHGNDWDGFPRRRRPPTGWTQGLSSPGGLRVFVFLS